MENGNEDRQLAHAVTVAAIAHEDASDKSGTPYILHPIRMMHRALTGGMSRNLQIVTVLHDVQEDAPDVWEREKAAFSPLVREAVDHVTKRESEKGKENYEVFVTRICEAKGESGRIARRVKLLDLEDNLDILRIGELSDKDAERMRKYLKARKQILAAITDRDQ